MPKLKTNLTNQNLQNLIRLLEKLQMNQLKFCQLINHKLIFKYLDNLSLRANQRLCCKIKQAIVHLSILQQLITAISTEMTLKQPRLARGNKSLKLKRIKFQNKTFPFHKACLQKLKLHECLNTVSLKKWLKVPTELFYLQNEQ